MTADQSRDPCQSTNGGRSATPSGPPWWFWIVAGLPGPILAAVAYDFGWQWWVILIAFFLPEEVVALACIAAFLIRLLGGGPWLDRKFTILDDNAVAKVARDRGFGVKTSNDGVCTVRKNTGPSDHRATGGDAVL